MRAETFLGMATFLICRDSRPGNPPADTTNRNALFIPDYPVWRNRPALWGVAGIGACMGSFGKGKGNRRFTGYLWGFTGVFRQEGKPRNVAGQWRTFGGTVVDARGI